MNTFSAVVLTAGLALAPFAARAATFALSPSKISVHPGDAFTVHVDVISPDVAAYTVKADGLFTPDVIQLSVWTYADAWNPLRQPGYDAFSGVLGTFTRTAGFPAGFSGRERFADVAFVAGAAGTGTISLSPQSAVYDADGANVYAGANSVEVTVLAAPPPAVPAPLAPPPTVVEPPVSPPVVEPPPLFDVSAQVQPQGSGGPVLYGLGVVALGALLGAGFLYAKEHMARRRVRHQKGKRV